MHAGREKKGVFGGPFRQRSGPCTPDPSAARNLINLHPAPASAHMIFPLSHSSTAAIDKHQRPDTIHHFILRYDCILKILRFIFGTTSRSFGVDFAYVYRSSLTFAALVTFSGTFFT